MAKDDYPVVVYQILAYLYTQLKRGERVDPALLQHNGPYISINERYWKYIFVNLLNDGYVEGLIVTCPWGKEIIISNLEEIVITPKGIEYLTDNSFLRKAKEFLKETKSIVPFV